jgi:hypothetical protein
MRLAMPAAGGARACTRVAARVALAAATAGLMACNGHSSDRATSASASASASASDAVDRRDDATSARFAHPPSFETPSKVAGRGASGATGEEVATLEKKVARLENDVAALRAEVASGAGASQAAGATPNLLDRTQLAAMEAAFRGEAIDARWSAAMTDNVRASLAQGVIDHGAARSVECRSHSCRVELAQHDGSPAAPEIAALVGRLAPTLPHAQAGQFESPEGRLTVLYFSR